MNASITLACEGLGRYDSDTIHHHLRKLSPQHALAYAHHVNARLLELARRAGQLQKPQVVALDTHKDPDWTQDHEDCIRARGHRGTSYVLDYLSLETIGNTRFTLAFQPVTQEQPVRDCYRPVLEQALQRAPIQLLLGDRGLYGRPLLVHLHELDIPYVIAAPRNSVVKRRIKNTKRRLKRIPKTRCYYAETTITFRHHGPTLSTNLVLFWRPDKNKKKLVCFPFITSEKNLTPKRAHELAYLYLKRWHIETGYRIKNKLRVRTCSPHAGIRRFLQYFSILAHNLWMLHRWLARQTGRATIVTVRLFQIMLGKLAEGAN